MRIFFLKISVDSYQENLGNWGEHSNNSWLQTNNNFILLLWVIISSVWMGEGSREKAPQLWVAPRPVSNHPVEPPLKAENLSNSCAGKTSNHLSDVIENPPGQGNLQCRSGGSEVPFIRKCFHPSKCNQRMAFEPGVIHPDLRRVS